MGSCVCPLACTGTTMIKSLTFFLLVVITCVLAEPEPYRGYGGRGYGGYGGYRGGYRGGYGGRFYGKRSAEPEAVAAPEAEPEADAYYGDMDSRGYRWIRNGRYTGGLVEDTGGYGYRW
eukprot:TRINITY_DN4828_c0_g1_i1.p1 TRINITY_DN4828_c0_g1~~TRINITY_DN4828_c0_g1_i1.p1  ORF type:complete len:119 (-),score=22.51 TRINITY_DN4828_c0_g1_i1:118-474(-)